MGADTPTAKQAVVVEDADYIDPETGKRINPNGVKRARRIYVIESYHKRDRNPILDKRQFTAAEALSKAFERTQRSAPAIKKVQVDNTPKPDANVAIMVDRISKFHELWCHVPPECAAVLDVVVLQNRSIAAHPAYRGRQHERGVELLQWGLNAVADGMELTGNKFRGRNT